MDEKMSSGLKTAFLIHLIVGVAFGIVYISVPDVWGNLVNWPVEDLPAYRLIGAALLGFAASSLFAYRQTSWNEVKVVVQSEIVWTILATVVTLWGLITGDIPAFGWVNAVILAAFAGIFSIFYLRHQRLVSRSAAPARYP